MPLQEIELNPITSSLAIGIPTYDSKVMVDIMGPLIQLAMTFQFHKVPFKLIYNAGNALIELARNTIVDDFLKKTTAQKLLFLDADIIFTEKDVLRLLAWAQKYSVVGATYPSKRDAPSFLIQANKLNINQFKFNEDMLIEAEGFGAGFLMIDRSVFEQLQDKVPLIKAWDRDYHAYFKNEINGDLYTGEDISFLRLCARNGMIPVVDWQIALKHVGYKAYDHKLSDLFLRDGIVKEI